MAGSPSPSGFESLSRKLYEPLIPPLLAVIGGILFAWALRFEHTAPLFCAALSAALWLASRKLRFLSASFLAGNATMFWLATASASYANQKPVPVLDANPRELISLEGCVDSLPQRESERLFFTFTAAPGARLRVSFYLKPEESAPDWSYGHRLQLPLRVKPIHNAGNPGNFDAERYFAHRDIYWAATIAKGYPIVQVPNACGNPVSAAIYKSRQWLLERIEYISGGDRYLSAMLAALLFGDNAKLEDSWTDNYRRTGTYHAIVISGLHITVLAGALFALLRLMHFRPLQAYTCCAIAAILYALICDLSAPVVRAAGGYLLFLSAKFFYRKGRSLNLLAAIAILYLLADPAQLFEASFQLSFLAVLTLATLADPLLKHTTGPWLRALRALNQDRTQSADPTVGPCLLELQLLSGTLSRLFKLKPNLTAKVLYYSLTAILTGIELFLTSGVVLIGLCLPMILFFHRLTFSSLTANLPVVFLLSLAVPLGFLAIFTGPMLTPILKWLLYTSRDVVDWHLTWDTATRIPDPPAWILFAFPAALLATAFTARKYPRWSVLPIATVAALFLFLVTHPYSKQPSLHPNRLEITAIDVGQGDGLFLATPQGHLALLDSGGSRFSRFDPGESTVSPYLWHRHIAKLDTLIASHGDMDHMGGLLAIEENFHPREIWVSSQVSGDLWEKLKLQATKRHVNIRYLSQGDCLRLGELEVNVLWPPKDEPIAKSNLTSLVLLLTHGTKRFLLTGDIDQSIEARLLENPLLPRLDFLKVAHHGSKTSTSEAFLELTRPAIAVSSSGRYNNFNHPHPKVVSRLDQSHTLLLRTDLLGQITILSDGHRLTTDPFRYRIPARTGWIPFTQALE